MKTELTIEESQHLIDLGVDPKLASKCLLYFCDVYDEPLASWDRYEEHGKVFCSTEEAYGRSVESRIVSMDADFDQSAKEENPIFDLSDVIEALPKMIGVLHLNIDAIKEGFTVGYVEWADDEKWEAVIKEFKPEGFFASELIDALYNLLCWYLTEFKKKEK